MVEIKAPTTPVKTQKTEIITANSNAAVSILGSSKLQVTPADYVIAQSTYDGNVPKGISQWIQNEIALSVESGNIGTAIENIRTTLMNAISSGVNQYIETLTTDYVSQSALTTTLGSAIGAVDAKILNVQQTFATENEAFATEIAGLRAKLGDDGSPGAIEAYIGNIAIAAATDEFASATDMTSLVAVYNEQTLRIDTLDNVTVTPEGWTLGASKLATTPDNSIVGWSFSDGSNEVSEFKINAQKFSVSDGVTGYTPFSITGSNILFNGVVDFTSTNNYGTTTIDGDNITTGSITAGQIAANTITADKIQSVYINGYTIEGAVIRGASIEGSVIKSSWIDYTTTGDLTNWQYYTTSTIPSAYEANFAHDNVTGALIVDSLGYVRLPGVVRLFSQSYSSTASGTRSLSQYDLIFPYSSYTQSNARRSVSDNPLIVKDSASYIFNFEWGSCTPYFTFKILNDTYVIMFGAYFYFTLESLSLIVKKNGTQVYNSGTGTTTVKTYTFTSGIFSFTAEWNGSVGFVRMNAITAVLSTLSSYPSIFSNFTVGLQGSVTLASCSDIGSTTMSIPSFLVQS